MPTVLLSAVAKHLGKMTDGVGGPESVPQYPMFPIHHEASHYHFGREAGVSLHEMDISFHALHSLLFLNERPIYFPKCQKLPISTICEQIRHLLLAAIALPKNVSM